MAREADKPSLTRIAMPCNPSRESIVATRNAVSTKTDLLMHLLVQVLVDAGGAVGSPARSLALRQRQQHVGAKTLRFRLVGDVRNHPVDFHLDAVSWLEVDHVGRQSELVIKCQL